MMLTFSLPVIQMCLWYSVYGAVTISPKDEFPLKGQNFTFSCKNDISGNNINWASGTGASSSSLTTCDASTDNTCFPTAAGYTFSSDVSINTFYMQIDSVSLSNCETYTCNDVTTTESDLIQIKISDINTAVSTLTVSEPAEKTNGSVSIETDCLTPVTAILSQRCTYYSKDGVEYETCVNETETSSSTGCTDTCSGQGWVKVTVQYQYTQATNNPVEGHLRVRIKHTGDPNNAREIVWNSTNIQLVEKLVKGCICSCDIHKIVWAVISLILSLGSIAWILFVIREDSKRTWLGNKLWNQAHLCMIGWVVVSLVYSIIAVILFYVLVCKNDCCEAVCDCVCNCWPVYIIIGYIILGVDVIVDIIGVVAFINGDEKDAESSIPMSESQVDATNQPTDAKHKAWNRPQPLPPVGGQNEHRKGDRYDNMPAVDKKKLPPLSG